MYVSYMKFQNNRTIISVGDGDKQHESVGDTSTDPTMSSEQSNSPPSTLGISLFHENISKVIFCRKICDNVFSFSRKRLLIL